MCIVTWLLQPLQAFHLKNWHHEYLDFVKKVFLFFSECLRYAVTWKFQEWHFVTATLIGVSNRLSRLQITLWLRLDFVSTRLAVPKKCRQIRIYRTWFETTEFRDQPIHPIPIASPCLNGAPHYSKVDSSQAFYLVYQNKLELGITRLKTYKFRLI